MLDMLLVANDEQQHESSLPGPDQHSNKAMNAVDAALYSAQPLLESSGLERWVCFRWI